VAFKSWQQQRGKSTRKSKTPIVHYKEGVNPWVSYFHQQIETKSNCIYGIFHGKVGSGKSYAMLSLAEQYNPDVDLNESFYFSAGKMMKDIDKFYNHNLGKIKRGKEWYLDEAGISVAAHKHYDAVNKGLNAFMQTARAFNPVFLVTVPNFNFVSKGVRTMMNVVGETIGWSGETNLSNVSMRVLDYNADMDKYYKKRLFVVKNGEGVIPCNQSTFPKPSKRILKEYEQLKREFMGDLFKNIAREIQSYEDKEQEKSYGNEPTPKQKEILELLAQGRIVPDIATFKGIDPDTVRASMRLLKKKGYKFDGIRDEKTNKITYYNVITPE